MKKLWGISWLYVLQMASASCSFKDLFYSLFFFICWCTCGNSFPFYLRLWPLAAPRAHPRADRRAWLQLPHMTSPFASWHSLHLPSPGPTKDKVCLKSVCAYVKVCEYYQAKCHSFISYIQYCVVDFLSSQEKHKHKCRHICTQTPTLVCIDMAQNERTSTLFNLAELCFFWSLIRSDFMAMIGQYTSTPLCTLKIHSRTHRHKDVQTHCLLYFLHWAVWLASSPATVPKGQRWPPLGSASSMSFRSSLAVWVCVCVSVCVCVCVVSVTAWPLWSSLLSWSFLPCIYTI